MGEIRVMHEQNAEIRPKLKDGLTVSREVKDKIVSIIHSLNERIKKKITYTTLMKGLTFLKVQ